MTPYEQLARRYCALLGEDPDERIDGVPIWRVALADLEAAMNALDTYGMDVRESFHRLAEANSPVIGRPFMRRLRSVA
jgi:hypothetical protein